MEECRDELALLETLDNGKPLGLNPNTNPKPKPKPKPNPIHLGESRDIDMGLTLQAYRYYAGYADKITGLVTNPGGPIAKGAFGYIEREPVGVVAQIIPWNFPLLMMVHVHVHVLTHSCLYDIRSYM